MIWRGWSLFRTSEIFQNVSQAKSILILGELYSYCMELWSNWWLILWETDWEREIAYIRGRANDCVKKYLQHVLLLPHFVESLVRFTLKIIIDVVRLSFTSAVNISEFE